MVKLSGAVVPGSLSWPFKILQEDKEMTVWSVAVVREQKGEGWTDCGVRFVMDKKDRALVGLAMSELLHALDRRPVLDYLLRSPFHLAEVRRLYEILLDTQLDRRNFRRQMLLAGFIVPEGEAYRFDGAAFEKWATNHQKKIF